MIINIIVQVLGKVLLGAAANSIVLPIYYALLYWDRCSELSADRASMLVLKDFPAFIICDDKGNDFFENIV